MEGHTHGFGEVTNGIYQGFLHQLQHNDRTWAEWIAWTLEEKGYTTIIQSWDFLPGSNFSLEMKKGLASARRMLAVLSPNYLSSKFAKAEWAAAFARIPRVKKESCFRFASPTSPSRRLVLSEGVSPSEDYGCNETEVLE